MEKSASTSFDGVKVLFTRDATGYNGNTCTIISQYQDDSLHLMPEHVMWLFKALNDIIVEMKEDGYTF